MNKFFINLCCCFIWGKRNRDNFRKKYLNKRRYLSYKDFLIRIKLFFLTNKCNLNKIFKNKTVAIIGNAESIFNYSFGEDIDKHDIVIRINKGFVINEKSQGQKTTILATSCIELYEDDIKNKFNPEYVIWLTPKLTTMPKFSKQFLKKLFMYKILYWYRLKNKINTRPTSGLMLIDLLTKYTKVKSVDLYGFDFFETNTFYNNIDLDKIKQSTPHKFDDEKSFVLNLEKQNKIKIFGFNANDSNVKNDC